MRVHPYLPLLVCLLASACAPTQSLVVPSIQAPLPYEQLFPRYVEVCAVSQLRPLEADYGGSAGHAVVYLKGACSDPDSAYPRIEMCPGDADLTDPETGVGISVNKYFKTVNWVAVPGKRLFFRGDLEEDQRLTEAHSWDTVRKALRLGVFRGVEFHDQYLANKPDGMTDTDFIASESLGTDYALSFGRSVFCARVPVTASMLEDVISFLNGLNREYAEGEAQYDWSGYHDNCSHTVRNALASADIWASKSVRAIKLRQLFNLAIPANEFANLAVLATEDSAIDTFPEVYDDRVMRKSLLERNWLPARHGALLQTLGVHQPNDLYDTQFRIFVLEGPIFKGKRKRIRRMLGDDRYVDLASSLAWWEERYQAILAGKPSDVASRAWTQEYKQTLGVYYRYVEEQLREVRRMRASLRASGD